MCCNELCIIAQSYGVVQQTQGIKDGTHSMQHALFLCNSGTVMYAMTSEGISDVVCAMCEANGLMNQHL